MRAQIPAVCDADQNFCQNQTNIILTCLFYMPVFSGNIQEEGGLGLH